ncbi:acyl-CoA/acyl-ACP dehydrogenase [Nocardia sp. CDC159]|uniref:Acyl-CoA/acyl-ACP dehydrogenase n=1 Tax=Nocardia pulmonis TaxID=2951408 RepID=A0A9X2ECZ8_9NOCA|nr:MULTISPECIES: acyl-CoA dehydrogenase family protein [Nocardia]MCM6777120.1 acyl-CoA/acyl-ACP dehydrogenase [Nocardia pulmonis]MCM6790005.1 acyl-CoA/acyl-ACP dehydrogenase [Nocardia sp. CDC159]
MRSLDEARAVCERRLPGLYSALADVPLPELEQPGNPGLELFRKFGGPGLVIPAAYGGCGVDPLEAVAVVRALASVAPSLSVATAMHHFSVATLFTLADSLRAAGTEWAVLQGIADQNLLVASGFAEGRPGQGILSPTVTAAPVAGGYRISGSKRPCSMASSMDLLSASAAVPGRAEPLMLLIPAAAEGISVHPFWSTPILAGAESEEVRLAEVFVDERLAVTAGVDAHGVLDELQTVGFLWFELLICACYLGMASALVERAFRAGRASRETLSDLGIRLESAALLLEPVARLLIEGRCDNAALAKTVLARFAVQDAIGEAAARAMAALGGMAFVTTPEVAYLATASRCLAFHPPTRAACGDALAESLSGAPFLID